MGVNALEVRRRVMLAQPHEAVASGAVASFVTDVKSPLPLEFDLEPIQSGSGDPSPDNIRPITGHDGFTVYNDPKYGGLIRWNQISDADNYRTGTVSDVVITKSGNVMVANGTASANAYIKIFNKANVPTVAGHKYVVIVPANNDTTYYEDSTVRQYTNKNAPFIFVSSGVPINPYCRIFSGVNVTNAEISMQIFDITEMFGAGNEPSTVAEFRALFPLDYYAYNSGETTCVSAVSNLPYTKRETDFPTPPGTVYGGHVTDNGDGTGTVKPTQYEFVPTTVGTVGTASTGVKYASVSLPNNGPTETLANSHISSEYKLTVNAPSADGYFRVTANGTLFIYDNRFTSKEVAEQILADEKPQFVIQLRIADQQEYVLSLTAIQSIIGQNHVWVDNADEVSVEYWGH